MANIRDDSVNVLDISSGDNVSYTSSHIGKMNTKMPNISFLEINHPITNLIVLNDSYGSGGSSIKDGSEPSSSHSRGNTSDSMGGVRGMNYDNSANRDVDVIPSSLV